MSSTGTKSKAKGKSNSKELDFSQLHIICAIGENQVHQNLELINKNFQPNNRFQLYQLPLQTGDILIGTHTPANQITPSQEENLGEQTLKNYPVLSEVQPLFLIERKTIADFCQSYRSQHYQNQKTRMISFRQQNPNCQCYLVVEGYHKKPASGYAKNFPQSTVQSCFASIMVRDHFFIQHVTNTETHADFIHKILRTLVRYDLINNPESILDQSQSHNQQFQFQALNTTYQETVAIKKKTNMTPELCYKVQLTAVPGISMNISEKISQQYPNLSSLITELKQNEHKNLQTINLGNQKLGPAKAKRILEYLLPAEPKPSLTLTPTPS